MSLAHLTTGSVEPPKVEGKLRLYSMEFCPYAQRVRLVLKAKNIEHDTVNINLLNKPEWYFKIHPEGKVPAINTGSEIIVESLDISYYLDEKYPNNPLLPKDEATKQKDKDLISKIDSVTSVFYQCLINSSEKTPEQWIQEFIPVLEVFEKELAARGSVFFGGANPGMVDYMLWPWGERAGAVALKLGQKLPLSDDQLSALRKWRKAMRDVPVCNEMYHGPEIFVKLVEAKLKNLPVDYDNLS